MAKTHLYIIAQDLGKEKHFKIGITADVAKRLAQLQTGNPHTLQVCHGITLPTRDLAKGVEWHMHNYLRQFRVSGEWFRCDYEDLICALPAAVNIFRAELGLRDEMHVLKALGFPQASEAA